MSREDFHLSDSSDQELRSYRPLSGLALAAAAVGLLSAAALIAAPLWLIPIVGIILSVAALQSSSLRSGAAGGKPAALLGLMLATFFLTLAVGRVAYLRQQIHREARFAAERWLELVRQGELEAAHQATLPPYRRQISPYGLRTVYESTDELQQGRDQLFEEPPARHVVHRGLSAQWEFVRSAEQSAEQQSWYVVLHYSISGDDEPPVLARVVLRRFDAGKGEPASWQVISFAEAQG